MMLNELNIRERCDRICKDKSKCFALNKEHLLCVADCVVNKAASVQELIKIAITENKCEHIKEILHIADNSLTDLFAWVQYLQTIEREKELIWG